jgi:hypothetical protein
VIAAPIVIAMMMEAASPSETSVNSYQTTRLNNPEDSHLRARRRENLKSQSDVSIKVEVSHVLSRNVTV